MKICLILFLLTYGSGKLPFVKYLKEVTIPSEKFGLNKVDTFTQTPVEMILLSGSCPERMVSNSTHLV